jgi:hypothetical protein
MTAGVSVWKRVVQIERQERTDVFSCRFLFVFCRETGTDPFVPAAFQRKDACISILHELPCHTGTGRLVVSGSVEN